ncbi:MAG: hypothetical protein E6X21_15065 [Clostridium sp.]|uniref:major tail protein n=1 Tax=Clostridium sp. TaxID=1506 RepID=UPI00290F2AB2|nr:hypothetical protein [Clostridium sp.]
MANTSFNIVDGVGKIYYALLDPKTEEYQAVKLFSDMVIEFGMTPAQESKPVHGSNREITQLKGLLTGAVTMTIQSIASDVKAECFGLEVANEGGTIDKGSTPPYIALMVEKSLDHGEMEYLTLYRGQLTNIGDKAKTKENSTPEAQPIEISGNYSQLSDGLFKWAVRSTDTGFNSETFATNWGKKVIKPTKKSQ